MVKIKILTSKSNKTQTCMIKLYNADERNQRRPK